MEPSQCSLHKQPKSLYCVDCKTAQCPKCTASESKPRYCRPDHKKITVADFVNENLRYAKDKVMRITEQVSELTLLEHTTDKCIDKLGKLQTDGYVDLFNALRI